MSSRHSRIAVLGLCLALFAGLAVLSSGQQAVTAFRVVGNEPLRLAWMRQEAALEPTWPDQPRFTSDGAFRPVPAGELVLLTSSRHDSVTAIASRNGEVRWRFLADGPVRFPPAVWKGNAYVVADDGYLYCLESDTGSLVWKFRGGPSDRRILGNERLISTWPARGAPVVANESDGRATVYFAAGIWPFMGIFLHALDATTGEPRWQNSGDGATYIKQPHQTDAFAGIAPQGSLVVAGDRLLVPGGRSIPACYDRHTGKLLHYRLADASKLGGGPDLLVANDLYVNGGGAFDLATGGFLGLVGEPAVAEGSRLYSVLGTVCRTFDLEARPEVPLEPVEKSKDKKKARKPVISETWLGRPLAAVRVPATTALLPAHGRLYGAGKGLVWGFELPLQPGKPALWQALIEGTAAHLAATEEHLFVSTREGRLYCFGARPGPGTTFPLQAEPLPPSDEPARRITAHVRDTLRIRDGYAVILSPRARLVHELLLQTDLRLLLLEPDPARASALREWLRRANVDGKRAAILESSLADAQLPPYLASLILGPEFPARGTESDAALFDTLFSALRPHGGIACFPTEVESWNRVTAWLAIRSGENQARGEEQGGFLHIRRPGPLPGAGDWTHQHANPANTRVSTDRRVMAPLGVLWFGGPGNQGVLPRHGHGPVPQVCEGRLVIEGPDRLRALDVYTGRLLWETLLPGVGTIYDNVAHQPGANAAGSNYVTTHDGVYVAFRNSCLRLDPATGQMRQRYRLPPLPRQKDAPVWSFLTVAGDYLVGGAGKTGATEPAKASKKAGSTPTAYPASQRLTILDRRSGKALYSVQARDGFRHNGICIADGRLFVLDRPMQPEKKGSKAPEPRSGRLLAFDLKTGQQLWSADRAIFGTWLSASAEHGVLVEAGLMSRDTLADEPPGMRAYDLRTGRELWYRKEYFGPAILHGNRILKGGDARAGSGTACDLRTGEPIRIDDPLTGQATEWRWERTYGCNTPAACENLLLFRSGAAGFYDLQRNGGTGNLGGFRSSCTLNMIAAGGVLTVPDYTRTCTCSYQNQCSVGLIHTPEVELWTFTTARPIQGRIRQAGINLGAPGGRKASNGTLWLEYPPVGGPSPKLTITTVPAKPETFRLHQSRVEGEGMKWVGASGMRGLERLRMTLANGNGSDKRQEVTVRLIFLEPDGLGPGERTFDVALQGKPVLERLDVSARAGGPGRVYAFECHGVEVRRELTITLKPSDEGQGREPVLSGIEILPHEARSPVRTEE